MKKLLLLILIVNSLFVFAQTYYIKVEDVNETRRINAENNAIINSYYRDLNERFNQQKKENYTNINDTLNKLYEKCTFLKRLDICLRIVVVKDDNIKLYQIKNRNRYVKTMKKVENKIELIHIELK